MKLPPQLFMHREDIAPSKQNFISIKNYHVKPQGGLWTSTYDPTIGSAWVQWCLAEDFGGPSWYSWVLYPSSAKVYVIDGYADFEKIIQQFLHQPFPDKAPILSFVDYEKVAHHYDAIHLTEAGQQATRFTFPNSLYGWDCESTLWFRWKFNRVKPLGRKTFSRIDG